MIPIFLNKSIKFQKKCHILQTLGIAFKTYKMLYCMKIFKVLFETNFYKKYHGYLNKKLFLITFFLALDF